MAQRKALTARSATTMARPGLHADGATSGLYLQVTTGADGSIARSYKFRFTSPVTRTRRDMGLGPISTVSLAEARVAAEKARLALLQGLDPIRERERGRDAQRLEAARRITFGDATDQCIQTKRPEWSNLKHIEQWTNSLKTHAKCIAALPVGDIDRSAVMRVLEPIWTSKPETASRVRQRIEAVLYWAAARGYRTGANPAALKGGLRELLPRMAKTKRVVHHPAVPYREINGFVQTLRSKTGVSALALEFLILTAARTGEVIGAQWEEIDLEAMLWTVPAARMKSRRQHQVPLCARAVEILKLARALRRNDHVFPGNAMKKRGGLSSAALLELMRDMDTFNDCVPHGFRSSFRDWAGDHSHFVPETIEAALAHAIRNATEAAYRRSNQIEKRRQLMAAWQRYIDTAPKAQSVIVPISRQRKSA